MSKKRRIILSLLLAGYLTTGKASSQLWEFPLTPGTAAWQVSSSEEATQRFQMLQIPDEEISQISTSHLIKLCITYPFMNDMYAFSILQDALALQKQRFNGFGELQSRTDLEGELMKMHNTLFPTEKQVQDFDTQALIRQDNFILLLSDPLFLNQISQQERITVMETLYKRIQQWEQQSSDNDITLEYMVISRIMNLNKCGIYSPKRSTSLPLELEDVIAGIKVSDSSETVKALRAYSETFQINLASPQVPQSRSAGFEVTDPSSKLQMQAASYASNYPNARVIGPATKEYNCWNFAYQQPFDGNSDKRRWMSREEVQHLLTKGIFTKVSPSTATTVEYPGTRGLEGNPKAPTPHYYGAYENYWHGAQIVNWAPRAKDITGEYVGSMVVGEPYLRSKWGGLYMMEHSWFDCPYYTTYRFTEYQEGFTHMVEGDILTSGIELSGSFINYIAENVKKYYQSPNGVLYVEMKSGSRRIYCGEPENRIPFTKEMLYTTKQSATIFTPIIPVL